NYYYKNQITKRVINFLYLIGKVIYVFLNMFSSIKIFKWRTSLIKLQIEGLFLQLKHGRKKQYEKQFNVPYKMLFNQNKAFINYTIAPQDVVIDLFKASEDIVFVHDKEFLGWNKLA